MAIHQALEVPGRAVQDIPLVHNTQEVTGRMDLQHLYRAHRTLELVLRTTQAPAILQASRPGLDFRMGVAGRHTHLTENTYLLIEFCNDAFALMKSVLKTNVLKM